MRKNKFLIRVMSLILICILAVGLAAPVSAASNVTFTLVSKDYHSGTFIPTTHFTAGENVYVVLETTQIASIGGITLKLNYNKDLFTFNENTSFCVMNDGKGELYFNNKDGVITTTWETTLSDTAVTAGPMIYFIFKSKEDVSKNIAGNFSVQILELFDGSKAQKNIAFSGPAAIDVTLVSHEIPANKLALFEALETIKYPLSLFEIERAEAAFAAFTSGQQATFRTKHSDLYEYFTTARSRYYKLAEEATLDEILAEVEAFEKNYADVLALTIETVKLDDSNRVNEASASLENMSAAGKAKFSDAKKKLIADLKARVLVLEAEDKELKAALAEVEEFRTSYKQLFDGGDITQYFESAHTLYGPIISEAILVHSIMSEKAKELTANEINLLKEWRKQIDDIIARNARQEEISNGVAAFQQQYLEVFKLNSRNVELADETGIKMALASYKKLADPDVKAGLEPKIKILESLLIVIENLKAVDEEDPDDEENIQIVEKEVIKIVTVEKEVIKEVEKPIEIEKEVIKEVEKPVEVEKEVIKEIEKEVIKEVEKPVEVEKEVIKEVEKEVIKEVEKPVEVEKIVTETQTIEKTVNTTKLLETGFSTNLWIMLILLSVSILLGVATFYVNFLLQKEEKNIDE